MRAVDPLLSAGAPIQDLPPSKRTQPPNHPTPALREPKNAPRWRRGASRRPRLPRCLQEAAPWSSTRCNITSKFPRCKWTWTQHFAPSRKKSQNDVDPMFVQTENHRAMLTPMLTPTLNPMFVKTQIHENDVGLMLLRWPPCFFWGRASVNLLGAPKANRRTPRKQFTRSMRSPAPMVRRNRYHAIFRIALNRIPRAHAYELKFSRKLGHCNAAKGAARSPLRFTHRGMAQRPAIFRRSHSSVG